MLDGHVVPLIDPVFGSHVTSQSFSPGLTSAQAQTPFRQLWPWERSHGGPLPQRHAPVVASAWSATWQSRQFLHVPFTQMEP
jgi:hypothetical protein